MSISISEFIQGLHWGQADTFGVAEASEAIRREKQIKDYARAKKLAIVESSNPEWKDLSEHWFLDVSTSHSSLRSE